MSDGSEISAFEEYATKVFAVAVAATVVWLFGSLPWFSAAALSIGGVVMFITFMATTNSAMFERPYNIVRSIMWGSTVIVFGGAWVAFKAFTA